MSKTTAPSLPSLTLKIHAMCSLETSVNFNWTTRPHISGDSTFNMLVAFPLYYSASNKNVKRYKIHSVILPVSTVAMDVNARRKLCVTVFGCDSNSLRVVFNYIGEL